jgi:hypothetical protein
MSERFYNIEEHKIFLILYGAYKPFQLEFSMWYKMRIIVKYKANLIPYSRQVPDH